ncbi:hypothetical protein [Cohnella abietis]|uniref:Uncharacterized protein n=1 Tax=Cohnella abietis TaxID=2507935 RepID=A0A3T1CY07_9BACL|nr:hypothetical protein [Cohnella abietis]BBI30723.1 hypothetical protein KCTCHS21_01220 [Cohnella abietis]
MDELVDRDEMENAFTISNFKYPKVFNNYQRTAHLLSPKKIEDFRKQFTRDGKNQIEKHFIMFCIYKLTSLEEHALNEIRKAHKSYLRYTIAYLWEEVVFKALKLMFGSRILKYAILPNNRCPDFALDSEVDLSLYNPRGVNITHCEKIFECKTSLYNLDKEWLYYKNFCDKIVFVHLINGQEEINRKFDYASSDNLIEFLEDYEKPETKEVIERIEELKIKCRYDYVESEFLKRYMH